MTTNPENVTELHEVRNSKAAFEQALYDLMLDGEITAAQFEDEMLVLAAA